MDRPSPTRVGDHAPRPWVLAIVVLAVTAGCSPGAPTTEDPGAALPVATIADTVTVVAGPFDVRLVLDAILVPAERVPLDAPGTPSPLLADGTPVRRGDPVATAGPSPAELREARRALEDAQRAARAATPGSPEHQDQLVAVQRAAEDLSALESAQVSIVAPVDGVIRRTATGVEIQPAGMDAVADLLPLQAIRLLDTEPSATASVRVPAGEVALTCDDLRVHTLERDGTPQQQLRCPLGDAVPPVSGLPARIVVTLASLTDVLTVPATAIRLDDARATQGEVLVTGASGTVATRVQLGPSDGVRTVVTAGLEPGAQVHRVHHGGT